MDIRLSIVKLTAAVLKKMGRGGSFPGTLGLKMDKNFIQKFHMPDTVILVTGTNGKTTTQNLIAESLRASGLKVINNRRGDNLNVGIASLLATNSDSNFNVQADAAVIEVDELTLYRQFYNLHPTALVVTNFFRDQLDRAGEMETIIRKIMEVTEDFEGVLVLNGNDPNVMRIGENARKAHVKYFTVGKNEKSVKTTDEASEGKFCPKCGRPLNYVYYQYSHIGKFICHNDGFGNIKPYIEAQNINYEDGTFSVDGKTYHSFVNSIYGVYNCAAVLSIMKYLEIDPSYANQVFSTFELKEGRNELFQFDHPCILNLAKNPTGTNEVLKYILSRENDKNILILLNDNDQDGHDVSWIWDAHFERLNVPSVKKIVCSGLRAYDMALRLKYEGLEDRIIVMEDAEDAVKWLAREPLDSYVISTYTALHSTRAILKKEESQWK